MKSEIYKANSEVRKLYNKKLSAGEKTTVDKCRDEYAGIMNDSSWRTYLETLQIIDKENKICPKCFNIPAFNPLALCSKCGKRYDENGDEIKGNEDV